MELVVGTEGLTEWPWGVYATQGQYGSWHRCRLETLRCFTVHKKYAEPQYTC